MTEPELQPAVLDAVRAVPGGLTYAELAAAVFGLYQGAGVTRAQLSAVRRAASELRRRELVITAAAETQHARAGRPRVVVRVV